MIDRRTFIRSLAIACGSGLILPSSAEALVLGDRYNRLVTAIRDVLDSNSLVKGLAEPDRTAVLKQHNYTTKVDELMRVIIEEFDNMTPLKIDPVGTQHRVSEFFSNARALDILSEDELRQYEDIIIAIGVVRTLLHHYRIRMNPTEGLVDYWNIYGDRYGDLILNAVIL